MKGLRVLHVNDCHTALWAICREFVGSGSVSFEGDLTSFALGDLPGSSHQETAALKRQTQSPVLDFLVLPITLSNLMALESRITEEDLLGWEGAIHHVHVESCGQLALAACDNFHEDATVAFSPPVSELLLAQLKEQGVLRAVVTPNPSLERTRD